MARQAAAGLVRQMGIHDREYYRDDAPSHYEMASGWSVTTRLIIVNAAVFLLNLAIAQDHWLVRQLEATPASLVRPYLWWQLVTYGFAHSPQYIDHILWNMFALWVFGRPVEGIYGAKEFLRFYLVAIVLGGVFWTARMWLTPGGPGNSALIGASGAVTAVTLLFCIHYPRQTILLMMVLPVPAWFLGATIILFNVLGALSRDVGTAFDVHLVGAVFAMAYFKFSWHLGHWWPSWSIPRGLLRRRPKLRVLQPPDGDGDGEHDELAAQADLLLEKINREGIDSLSDRERRILERHSRRVRDKRR
jgi:membrane associated rhomboid family serine protease